MTWWPTAYSASAISMRHEILELKRKLSEVSNTEWFRKCAKSGLMGPKLQEIEKRLTDNEDACNKLIGYHGNLQAMRDALRRLDTVLHTRTDARTKGEAFGAVFEAASTFFSYAPFPFSAYETPLSEFGKAMGNIAELVTGDTKYTGKFGSFNKQQLQRVKNVDLHGDG